MASRTLRCGGEVVHLEPQAFDLLVYLIEHRDRVVTKNDLLDGVWGHRFVSEANLTTRVKEVRRAVGDDGTRQHVIKTVHGRGYQFVAVVDHHAPVVSSDGLIGRDGLIAAVSDRLRVSPLVTLTGTGGVGKSTVARAVASGLASSFADGVHIVELANIDSGAHVVQAIARALDIVLQSDRREHAVRTLANLDALVILDNCEHVIDEASELLDRVLSFGGGLRGGLRVLATSRVRLGLSVEQVQHIEPLGAEHAQMLFNVRALGAQASWVPGVVDRTSVARLVARLDHLPLTIEMAAARLGAMTFDELEAAIESGTNLLQVNHRSPARRHRSLESLVAWSAELLDADDRRAFAEMSVFAGPVSAADIAEVIDSQTPGRVVFTLGSLVDRSLLVAGTDGPSTKYRMLSTVKAVAGQWLDDDGPAAARVRRRHATHFANVSRSVDIAIRTPNELDGRGRLDAVVDEVRSAHIWARRWAPDLASEINAALHLAAYSTFWNEPAEWARVLLDRHPDATSGELLGARLAVAGSASNRGELELARVNLVGAVHSSDLRIKAAAIEIMSDICLYAGDLRSVATATDELGLLGTELADSHWVAIAAVNASLALTFAGRPAEAVERLKAAQLDGSSPTDRSWAIYARGEALSALGDRAAIDAYRSAIDLATSVGTPFVVSVARVALASEYSRAGDHHRALAVFADCLRSSARHGNYVHAVTLLRNMIEVFVAVGDDHGAVVIAAATSSELLRKSYGPEADRIGDVLQSVEGRVGSARYADWVSEGSELGVPTTVEFAAKRIALLALQSS